MDIDLKKISSIYFVGIKGVAMTSLAIHAKERGFIVSGSDVVEIFPTDEMLAKSGISVCVGFDSNNITNGETHPDLVIYTGAHNGRDNVEVVEAQKQRIPTLPHGKALGLFMNGTRQISAAGSHGKTTTTAMIATILSHAGLDPSYAIGCGEVRGLGLPGHFGNGEFFVAEADEYVTDPTGDDVPRFLWQSPEVLVITNIDYDHPDVYPSLAAVTAAFVKFRDKLPVNGALIMSSDDRASIPLAWNRSAVFSVGKDAKADYHVTKIYAEDGYTRFTLVSDGKTVLEGDLQIPGTHNAINAGMAAVAAHHVGVSWEDIAKGLSLFGGGKRRFEQLGSIDDIVFYDDYAHHPKEIAATLAAAKSWYPTRRIISVFQPHTFSRTKALLTEFAQSFGDSDIAILTDIYASAREHENLGMDGQTLVVETKKYHQNVVYAKDAEDVYLYLQKHIEPNDVILYMGAGDIYTWGREVTKKLGASYRI